MSPTGLRQSLLQRFLPRSQGVACLAAKPLLVSAPKCDEVPAARLMLMQFVLTAIKNWSQLPVRHTDLHTNVAL